MGYCIMIVSDLRRALRSKKKRLTNGRLQTIYAEWLETIYAEWLGNEEGWFRRRAVKYSFRIAVMTMTGTAKSLQIWLTASIPELPSAS